MATSQLTLFDLETLPGMICRKPTGKYPNGRTGTNTGYVAHRHAGESPCRECVDGRNKYRSEQSRKRAESKPADAPACATPSRRRPGGQTGTYAGYKLHLKEGEAPCQPCVDARDKRKRNLEASTRSEKSKYDLVCQAPSKKYPAGTTGTFAGLRAHEFYNQEPCPECEEAGKEHYAKHAAEYYQANRERALEYAKEWRRENPELARENAERSSQLRRARKLSLPAEHVTDEQITTEHGAVCYLCGKEVDLTLSHGSPSSPEKDHVHPLARPDSPGHILENLRWTHLRCNRSKSDKLVSELTLPFPPPQATTTELPGTPVQAQ